MEPNTPPPVQQAPPPPKSKWPTIIGIIALVFGILGLLGALTALANPFLIGTQMENAVQQGISDREAVDAYMADFRKLQWFVIPIGFTLGLILTLGGVLLLKRKPSAPLLLKVWSVLKVGGGGFLLFKGAALSRDQLDLLVGGNAAGTSQAEMAGEIASVVSKVVFVCQAAWLIALPLFLLIWFSRAKIKEAVANW